jgi:hypothetical protein
MKTELARAGTRGLTFVEQARWIRHIASGAPDEAVLSSLWSAFEIEPDSAMRKLLAMALVRLAEVPEATTEHPDARMARALREALACQW